MRNDVKELADAMEKGWEKCPTMVDGPAYCRGNPQSPSACCAKGHAFLGKFGSAMPDHGAAERQDRFQAFHQIVLDEEGDPTTLFLLLNDLTHQYNWTTPQIVKWLRSHQND